MRERLLDETKRDGQDWASAHADAMWLDATYQSHFSTPVQPANLTDLLNMASGERVKANLTPKNRLRLNEISSTRIDRLTQEMDRDDRNRVRTH